MFESSPEEFHEFPEVYIHRSEQKSDTGIKVELLQKYVFIPIDIFKKRQHNKDITGELDAWLMFFCGEKPEEIVRLIEAYPQFKPMYEEAYEMCRNMEDIMGLFSKELRELDRNTVQLMIDEMQEELEQKRAELEERKEESERQKAEVERRKEEAERQKAEIKKQEAELNKQKAEAEQQKNAAEAERLRADRLEESERRKSEQLEQALRRIAELEKQKA